MATATTRQTKPDGFDAAFFDNAQCRHAFVQEPLIQFQK